ncbi:MAG: phosphate ABC transporter permease subunit PstC [Caldisericaceae bacterium]|nr:phosphate ABC transporter permease subunit PstC [Caldisericaceae bacterium]
MKLLLEPSTQTRNDGIFRLLTIVAASFILLIMILLFIELLSNSWLSLEKFGLQFLLTNVWDPVRQEFGALSSLYGTLVSTLIAMLIAVPLSLVIALFLVEMAPPMVSKFFGMAIELLAAIPSIIYGMWGLFVLAPLMAKYVQPFLQKISGNLFLFKGPPMGIGMFTAGIILAIMVLPFISSVMREVFLMVPNVVKESAVGMGATTWEMVKVMVRYGIQGMIGATFIGLSRAIGETMAVTFVIGNSHSISTSLFAPANSITATLANEFTEASEPVYLSALVELGLLLFVVTFIIQMVSQLWLKRVQKRMGVQ